MSANLRGVLAMVLSMAAFTAGDSIVKVCGASMPIGQIMFVRGLFATALCIGLAVHAGAFSRWPRAFSGLLACRTLFEISCTLAFFMGLVRLPFADAAAIGQFTPLAVTAGAALFLHEPVGWRRWGATLAGLAGVLLIIQPGSSTFQWPALFIVAAVLGVAARDLITRCLPPSVPTFLIAVLSSSSISLVGLALSAVEHWHWPPLSSIGLLMCAALTVTIGYYFSIVAMRSGESAVVAPFRYSAMIFALLISLAVFGELPDAMAMLGVTIVILAGLYTFHREQVRRHEGSPVTAAP